ncbi:MAG TPA: hypothetical protein VHO69_04285 [Phototrophicaceae bacterium]|nr:hypothetical protein [Phototrophicaceae bacterium]
MVEPHQEQGIWCFWLTADLPVLQFVTHLSCVLNVAYMPPPFLTRPQARILVRINPRYDPQEAWLWIYEQLERESLPVELNAVWETALDLACADDQDRLFGDNLWGND